MEPNLNDYCFKCGKEREFFINHRCIDGKWKPFLKETYRERIWTKVCSLAGKAIKAGKEDTSSD